MGYLEGSIQSHLATLKKFQEYLPTLLESTSSQNPLEIPQLYDSGSVLSWLLLLKSFSRSVTALRTTLKRNNLANLLLDLIRLIHEIFEKFTLNNVKASNFLKAEMKVMEITLGCICNFVVEFSNLQSYIISNGIVDIISSILEDPLFNSDRPWTPREREFVFEDVNTDKVKTNSLWVLRHLMYNCQNYEKLELLSKISMETILEFINDPCWKVQEQCFQLIRNLTCNSRKVINMLLREFKDVEYSTESGLSGQTSVGSTYLFEYLARKMKLLSPDDTIQKKILEGILYIIVNLAAVNENKKRLVIEQDEILGIIADILSENSKNKEAQKYHYGNDTNLKLACLWILNNLLWNSSIDHYAQFGVEDYSSDVENNSGEEGESTSEEKGSMLLDLRKPDMMSSSNNSNRNIAGDTEEMFVRSNEMESMSVSSAAKSRCQKLVAIGIRSLVKDNVFDESLSVREKARTLLYHMDAILKGGETDEGTDD